MSQSTTVPSRLPEGSGLVRVCLALQETACRLCNLKCRRQLLACSTATLTMIIVGTINGWTTISLPSLTSGTGGVPLKLTDDESSWMVSLTILGSMIGSLVAAQLADRGGRKYCLLVCSTMFTLGWFIIYDATSVPILYIARVILGIGIGIARTINPMYVSEVADMDIRGSLGTLIAVNVYTGSLLTCALGIWLLYKTLLLILVGISFASMLLITCFPETPYFLVAKGQKKQACKSISYYKGIVDLEKVKIELCALRAQTRYELHPKSRYELHQQTENNLPSQSRRDLTPQSNSDLPSQPRSDLPSQSRRDLTPQSSSDLPSQPRSDLPSQSRREVHSDSFWEVVDTEPMSELPSSSDSPSQSTCVIHTEVKCEVHPQPTNELRLQTLRELHSQSTSELHRPSTSQIDQPSASEIHRPSTSQIDQPSASEIHRPSTSQIDQPSASEIHRPSTSQIDQPSASQIHQPSISQIDQPSASQIHRPSTSKIHRPSTSQIDQPSASEIHRPSTSQIDQPSASEIHRPSTSQIDQPSASEIHRPSTSQIDQPSASEIHRPSTSQIDRPSTSQIDQPSASQIHQPSTSQIDQPSASQIHRPSTSKIHRPSTSQIDQPSASEIHRPSTSQIDQPSASEIHRPSTSQIDQPSASEIHRPSTSQIDQPSASQKHRPSTSQIDRPSTSQIDQPSASQIHRPCTSEINHPPTSEINPDLIYEIPPRSRSDSRTQPNVDSRGSLDIDELYMAGTKYICINKLRVILHQRNRKALFIMLGLIMAQQFSGNFITTQYLEELFRKITIVIDPQEASVLVQLFSLVSGALTILTVEFVGRRTLLIISTGGSCLTLSILATFLLLIEHKFDVSNVSIVPVIDLIIYEVAFQIGLGTLHNVLLCELFPTELKGFVGAIVVIFDGLISLLVMILYTVFTDHVGSYTIYFVFAISCFLAFLMVFRWVPETKGKTYDEIEALLAGENLNSLNEEVRNDEMDIRRI